MAINNKNHPQRRRATRTDVAKLANVSTAVVSYVFNNGPRAVAPDTSKRVREAAKLLNYHPNPTARALRTGYSKMLGVIVPDSSNPFSAGIYDELQTVAMRRGYSVLFMNVRSDPELEEQAIRQLLERNVDAIFLSSSRSYTQLSMAHLEECRFVFMDQPHRVTNAKSVSTDYFHSGLTATQHLIEHRHCSVDMLFGGSPDDRGDARIQGWYAAHQNANLPAGRIRQAFFTREGGYRATLDLIDSGRPPQAIFAGSDLEAMGALRALHERRLRIPDDVSIVSFDGTIDSLYTWPQLTTMQQDTVKIASCAINAALEPEQVPDVQTIKADMVVRHSCGC
nr:LacI family DNA-binding transcriptional regulator [Bifidobacterium indicum]